MSDINKVDKTMSKEQKKLLVKTMELGLEKKLSVGDLVLHTTVPQLGLGLIAYESPKHKNYWVVTWCDERYSDVAQLGIHARYLAKVN